MCAPTACPCPSHPCPLPHVFAQAYAWPRSSTNPRQPTHTTLTTTTTTRITTLTGISLSATTMPPLLYLSPPSEAPSPPCHRHTSCLSCRNRLLATRFVPLSKKTGSTPQPSARAPCFHIHSHCRHKHHIPLPTSSATSRAETDHHLEAPEGKPSHRPPLTTTCSPGHRARTPRDTPDQRAQPDTSLDASNTNTRTSSTTSTLNPRRIHLRQAQDNREVPPKGCWQEPQPAALETRTQQTPTLSKSSDNITPAQEAHLSSRTRLATNSRISNPRKSNHSQGISAFALHGMGTMLTSSPNASKSYL